MKVSQFAVAALCLAPFVSLFHWGADRISLGPMEALGCSGGAPIPQGPGFTYWYVTSSNVDPLQPIAIGTDGFFSLMGSLQDLEADEAAALVSVTLQNTAGEPVPGTVQVLQAPENGYVWLGWHADAELPMGEQLTGTVSVPGASGDALSQNVALSVVGPKATLSAPTLDLKEWVEVIHGEGPEVTCMGQNPGIGSCTPFPVPITFPGTEVNYVGQRIAVTLGGPLIQVAWEMSTLRLDTPDDPGTLSDTFTIFDPGQPYPDSYLLEYAQDAEQHCTKVVLRDLRDQTTIETEVFCSEPEDPFVTESDYQLGRCATPPNEALIARWCELNPNHGPDLCSSVANAGAAGQAAVDPGAMAGQAGTGPTAQAGATSTSDPSGNDPNSQPDAMASAGNVDAESGCTIQPRSARGEISGALLIALGLLGLATRRRRERAA